MSTLENATRGRVLVIDPEPVSRCGLIHLLHSNVRLEVIGECDSLPLARELCCQLKPDVSIYDSSYGDGVGFVRELRKCNPNGQVVVLTRHPDALNLQRAFQAGACGYVTRRDTVDSLISTVLGALDGERRIGPLAERLLLDRLAVGGMELSAAPEASLSDREMQIFQLLGRGLGTREVAGELRVSVKTIETHRQRIKTKLGLSTGTELQRRAVLYHESVSADVECLDGLRLGTSLFTEETPSAEPLCR